MSICVIKKGVLDTIQDQGRYGYQHLGINPCGAMDRVAMQIANALTGNVRQEPVLEIHFPAPILLFETAVLMAIGGADFDARLNQSQSVPINRCIAMKAGTQLSFHQQINGARAYIAVQDGFLIKSWLNSASTHIGLNGAGTILQNGMTLLFKKNTRSQPNENKVFNWGAVSPVNYQDHTIRYIAAHECNRLNQSIQEKLHNSSFVIDKTSNRMGYRLQGPDLTADTTTEIISTAVTGGTIQLLPNGQLIILMADHQTTGGYPRIGHIISADFPKLAQLKAGDSFQLKRVTLQQAHEELWKQELHLKQLEIACNLRMADSRSGMSDL